MNSEMPLDHLKIDTCQLCGLHPTKENSHIIPRLFSKNLTKHWGGGHLKFRFTAQPNQTHQDTAKLPFLCELCEDTLNEYETHFTPIYINHLLNQKAALEIDEKSYRLLVSINWRVARLLTHTGKPETLEHLEKPEKIWREYLLNQRADISPYPLFLFLARDFKSREIQHSKHLTHTMVHNWIGSGVKGIYGKDFKRQAVFTHLGPIITCGYMRDIENFLSHEARVWDQFTLTPNTTITSNPRKLPESFTSAADSIAGFIGSKLSSMSNQQKLKQKLFAEKNIKNTTMHKHLLLDKALFPD